MSNTIVRTNVMSLNSHRNLGLVGNQQSRASQRLSSGFRINSAADDAAGLGISEKMRSQIRGLDQASRNGQDGISLIQTAEGAMSTINEMVTRIRELVIQAANDTNAHNDLGGEATWSQSDRTRIQAEINQIMDEIDATRDRVEFNTRRLIDGSLGSGGVNRGLTGDLAILAEEFITDVELARVTNLDNLAQDEANLRNFLDQALAHQSSLIEIRTFLGPNATTAGPGLEQAIRAAVEEAANYWGQRVDAGIETNTTEANQATFLQTQVMENLNRDFADIGLAVALADLAFIDTAFITGQQGISTNAAGIASIQNAILGNAGTVTALQNAFLTAMAADIAPPPAAPAMAGTPPAAAGTYTAAPTLIPATFADWGALDTAITTTMSTIIGEIADDIGVASAAQGIVLGELNNELATNDRWEVLYERFGDFETLRNASERGEDGPGTPLWFQIGANANQGVHLSIEDVGVNALARVGTESGAVEDAIRLALEREGAQLDTGDLSTEEFAAQFTFDNLRSFLDGDTYATSTAYGAVGGVLRMSGEEINLFITAIDLALSHVTDQRSNLGAMQNRLEFTIENLDIASENLSAAESRIRDADMAMEMMRLTQANVLQQAAISMLAQANQAPQSVLQLLG